MSGLTLCSRRGKRRRADMAIASISYRWPTGEAVDLIVDSNDGTSHPDLLDELVARVLTLYRETCVGSEDGDD